jgi:transposase-like protein
MPRRKPKNKGGRPSKWTIPVAVELVTAMKRGTSFQRAARDAGIGKSTLYRWVAQAQAGDPRFAIMAPLIRPAPERWYRW